LKPFSFKASRKIAEEKFEVLLRVITDCIYDRAGEHSTDVAWSILREFERNIHILINAIYQEEWFHLITMIHMQKVSKFDAERGREVHPNAQQSGTSRTEMPPIMTCAQIAPTSLPSPAPAYNNTGLRSTLSPATVGANAQLRKLAHTFEERVLAFAMGICDPNVPEQDVNSDIIWHPPSLGLAHGMLNVVEMNKRYNLSSSTGNNAMRGHQQACREFEEAQPDWSNVSMMNV
jgi:hypothetical protein